MKEITTYADQYGKYYEVKSYEYAKKLYDVDELAPDIERIRERQLNQIGIL
jgi:hypothetical protein